MPSALPLSDPDRLAVENLAIVHAAAKRLGVSATDARRDDLVSAAHEALVLASRRFEPSKASFSTYAGRRVFGSMLNALAANSRRREVHKAEPAADGDSVHHPVVAPDAERSTLTAEVLAALEKLPPSSRALIKGHYLEERTLADVGARHGFSKTRASVRLAQAIEQLREHLDDECSVWPPQTKAAKRRFSHGQKVQVVSRACHSRASLSQLARDFEIPRTTIITWLRSSRTRLAS